MPSIRCPECAAAVRVPPKDLGTTIECPDCGKKFKAGDDSKDTSAAIEPAPSSARAPRSGRRRDWGDEDEPVPVKKSSRNTLLLVGGIVLALFLVCGGFAAVAGLFVVRTIQENEDRFELARQQQRQNQERQRQIQQDNRENGPFPQPQMNQRVPPPLDAGVPKVPATPLVVGPGNAVVTHNGVLTPDDPQFTAKPFKLFEADLEPGRKYRIELASQQMDSFLRLYGPNNEPLFENDDFRGLDSGIIFTPQQRGRYKIHATVLSSLRNHVPTPFTLTIRVE